MYGSLPDLDEHHMLGEHHIDCGPGMVLIGNRCVPAQSIIGEDHEVGGHHFRADTGSHHYYFSN